MSCLFARLLLFSCREQGYFLCPFNWTPNRDFKIKGFTNRHRPTTHSLFILSLRQTRGAFTIWKRLLTDSPTQQTGGFKCKGSEETTKNFFIETFVRSSFSSLLSSVSLFTSSPQLLLCPRRALLTLCDNSPAATPPATVHFVSFTPLLHSSGSVVTVTRVAQLLTGCLLYCMCDWTKLAPIYSSNWLRLWCQVEASLSWPPFPDNHLQPRSCL